MAQKDSSVTVVGQTGTTATAKALSKGKPSQPDTNMSTDAFTEKTVSLTLGFAYFKSGLSRTGPVALFLMRCLNSQITPVV